MTHDPEGKGRELCNDDEKNVRANWRIANLFVAHLYGVALRVDVDDLAGHGVAEARIEPYDITL